MLKFVYHLGVHKTGSTLLQSNLARNVDALRSQGIYYLNAEWPDGLERVRNRLRRIENITRETPSEDTMAFMNMRLVRIAARANAHTVLVSEENFIGSTVHRQLSWGIDPAGFYPSAADCLRALTWGIEPKAIRVILYSRMQDSLLRGHYSEALRVLATNEDFAGFLDHVDIEGFRFDELVSRLRDALSGAEFVVKPFEAIRGGAEEFVGNFMAACGIDPAQICLDTSFVNPELDTDQAAELRDLCARLRAGEKPRPIRIRAREINQTAGNRANPVEIPTSHKTRIDAAARGDLSERLLDEVP